MGMIGTDDFITKQHGFTLNIEILLMGNFKALFLAIIEAVPAGSNLIDHILYISPVITILYSDKQPATFIGQLPKRLLLNRGNSPSLVEAIPPAGCTAIAATSWRQVGPSHQSILLGQLKSRPFVGRSGAVPASTTARAGDL